MDGSFSGQLPGLVEETKAGLYQAAVEIMYRSQRLVPRDTGTLASSAIISEPEVVGTVVVCELGYGYGEQVNPKTGNLAGQYAVPVHERLDQKHAPPTQAKFLEQPAVEYEPVLEGTLAAYISRWKRGPGGLRMLLEPLGPSEAV